MNLVRRRFAATPPTVAVSSDERRSTPRAETGEMPVELYGEDPTLLLGIGYLVNLGINCAGIDTTVPLKRLQKFQMRFLVDKKYLVSVQAQVVRIVVKERKRYFGVQFLRTDVLHEKEFLEFIASHIE